MLPIIRRISIGLLLLPLAAGCANRQAAKLGNAFGRTLGKPVGVVATTVYETFLTSGKIVAEDIRAQRQKNRDKPANMETEVAPEDRQVTESEVASGQPAEIPHAASSRPATEKEVEFWK